MYVLRILFEAKGSRKQQELGYSERGHAGSGGGTNTSCGPSLMGTTVSERGRQSSVLVVGSVDSSSTARR